MPRSRTASAAGDVVCDEDAECFGLEKLPRLVPPEIRFKQAKEAMAISSRERLQVQNETRLQKFCQQADSLAEGYGMIVHYKYIFHAYLHAFEMEFEREHLHAITG